MRILGKSESQPAEILEQEGGFAAAGACVLGPALSAFVRWVLAEAVRNGKKRLYFLARDGYFMYQAASVYVQKLDLPVECRYLSCSRYSLRLPMYHLNLEEALDYICRDSIDADYTKLLNRAGLTDRERTQVLKALGMGENPGTKIRYAQLPHIKKALRQCPVFLELLEKHSLEAMPPLAGYLRQEGLLDGVEDALVDSGWVGSMQRTLNQLLASLGRTRPLEGYYWGLYELPEGVERNSYHCYDFSPEGQLRAKVNFNNNVFEAVFTAPHGMTLGYREEGGTFFPVYDRISREKQTAIETLEGFLMGYIRRDACRMAALDRGPRRRQVRKLLKLFMTRPTRAESELFGSLGFCDDVLEYGNRCLAPVMTSRELGQHHVLPKLLVQTGLWKKEIRETAWYEGSVVRSTPSGSYHLLQYRIYKYLLYIRQMLRWRIKHATGK